MSQFTVTTATSGCFDPRLSPSVDSVTVDQSSVYNFGVLEKYRDSFEIKKEVDYSEWIDFSISQKEWQVTQQDLDAYADVAVRLAAAMSAQTASCRLAPLRGAARPAMLMEVMTKGHLQFEFFDFKQGSSGRRDDEIRGALTKILQRTDPGQELRTVQIIDTAIGGYGINKLVSLLGLIRETSFSAQSWIVACHLLHPTNGHENTARIDGAENQTTPSFQVLVTRYPVPDLIVEDFDDALGFTLEMEDGLYIGKPSVVPGRFLLRQGERISLVESEDLSRTFDEFFSKAVTDSLLSDPNRELTEIVWLDYTQKQ